MTLLVLWYLYLPGMEIYWIPKVPGQVQPPWQTRHPATTPGEIMRNQAQMRRQKSHLLSPSSKEKTKPGQTHPADLKVCSWKNVLRKKAIKDVPCPSNLPQVLLLPPTLASHPGHLQTLPSSWARQTHFSKTGGSWPHPTQPHMSGRHGGLHASVDQDLLLRHRDQVSSTDTALVSQLGASGWMFTKKSAHYKSGFWILNWRDWGLHCDLSNNAPPQRWGRLLVLTVFCCYRGAVLGFYLDDPTWLQWFYEQTQSLCWCSHCLHCFKSQAHQREQFLNGKNLLSV